MRDDRGGLLRHATLDRGTIFRKATTMTLGFTLSDQMRRLAAIFLLGWASQIYGLAQQ